jgi:Zn-dependent protease with chaperone function
MQEDRGGSPVGSLTLYLVTAALELPVVLARYAAVYVVAAVALKASGHSGASAGEWAKLAVLPTLWSAAALVNPAGSGWWWQQQLGGREPSKREHLRYRAALDELQANTMMLLLKPKRWFVIDEAQPDAAVCGDTLMLSRGLLEGPHLLPVLAHELGHLRGIDARMTAALNRLVIDRLERPNANPEAAIPHPSTPRRSTPHPPGSSRAGGAGSIPRRPAAPVNGSTRNAEPARGLVRWAAHLTVVLLRGGLALRLTAPAWGQIWREAEYRADEWAARIGQGEALADFLQRELLKHDHPIPLVWLSDHTHPPTVLRIEQLRAGARGAPQPTPTQPPPGGPAPEVLMLETDR